jgi:hypothetical protein
MPTDSVASSARIFYISAMLYDAVDNINAEQGRLQEAAMCLIPSRIGAQTVPKVSHEIRNITTICRKQLRLGVNMLRE